MRLLHLIQRYAPYVGGSEQYFQELSERLANEGHTVTVYTTNAWDLERFWDPHKRAVDTPHEVLNGVRVERFPVAYLPFPRLAFGALRRGMALAARAPFDTSPLLFALGRLTPYLPALERALEHDDTPYALVHTANISLDGMVIAAYRLARRRRIPFVLTPFTHLGEADDPHVRRYYTMPHQLAMLKDADAVIVMTGRERAALVERGVPPAKLHQIGAGVDPERATGGQAERFRNKYGIAGPIIAYLGAAAYDKGTMHLVEAMTRVSQTHDATLVIAGPQLTQFEKFFAAQPEAVRACTRVLGFISDEDKRDLLAACDVLAMPSRTDSFGIVFLEAWLYDKPVIGAQAGGVPEIISDGRDGYLVRFGDTDALAARLIQLLDQPALARTLGAAGRRKVLEELTWARQYARLRALYRELTGE